MRCAGIDIGSRTVKLAVLEDGKLVLSRKSLTSHNPLETAGELMSDVASDVITATGYGRHLIRAHLDCPVISEIKAFALGSRFLREIVSQSLISADRTRRPFPWIMRGI